MGCLILAACLTPSFRAGAQDWPQILGPNRDGVAAASQLAFEKWPAAIPPRWTVDLGSGFAGAAIVDDSVLAFHRRGDQELLTCIRLDDGQTKWETAWPASYRTRVNPDGGPRCVPTVQAGKVVCYGAAGDLACVDLRDGRLLWNRPLRREYSADDGYFGAGSSPLVVEDQIIVCLGGKQAGIVSVDLQNGKTNWAATDYEASYAPPIALGPPHVGKALVVTRLNTTLLDLEDGRVLSEIRFGSRGPTVNAAAPIEVAPSLYLLTASYGVGATLLEVSGDKLVERWSGSDLLSSQYNSPVQIDGRVIGIDGREDVGEASLRAVDCKDQTVIWNQADFGTAHLIATGGNVLALTLDGELKHVSGAGKTYRELATTTLPAGDYRSLPALSRKLFIARASLSVTQSKLICIELP